MNYNVCTKLLCSTCFSTILYKLIQSLYETGKPLFKTFYNFAGQEACFFLNPKHFKTLKIVDFYEMSEFIYRIKTIIFSPKFFSVEKTKIIKDVVCMELKNEKILGIKKKIGLTFV